MSAQEELEKLEREMRERADLAHKTGGNARHVIAWADRIAAIREGLGKAQEPVGRVLAEDEMGIGYDRRMGDVIWFSGRKKPGFLYQSPPADSAHVLAEALDRIGDMTSTIQYVCENIGIKADGVKSIYDLAGLIADVAAHKSEVKG